VISEIPTFRKIMAANAKYKQHKITTEVMFKPLRALHRNAYTHTNIHPYVILNA
jgi:hypothetical protein